jgi:hypothetical protein
MLPRSAKIRAVRHTAQSLGGTDLPDDATLARVKRVDALEVAYEAALARLETEGVSSILTISFTDVEVRVSAVLVTLQEKLKGGTPVDVERCGTG